MKRRGFTLVEILTAVLLSAVVVSIALQVARQVTLTIERMSGRLLAFERGQNALSIIEPRALHAAFGITYERAGDVFRRSFGRNNMTSPQPARWTDRGPLQIWEGYPTLFNLAREAGGVSRGRGLAVLYAIPSALRAKLEDDIPLVMEEGESARIGLVPYEELPGLADRLPSDARGDLRTWVTFPLMRLPVHITQYLAEGPAIHMAEGSGLSATLFPYDEMHYLRAERFYVQNGLMYSEELTTTWENREERLEGVLEMWFEWAPSKKLLEAWILTTGGRLSSGGTARPDGWPPEAPWREEFELHHTAVARGSWLLKNM